MVSGERIGLVGPGGGAAGGVAGGAAGVGSAGGEGGGVAGGCADAASALDRLAQRKEPAVQAHESVTGTLASSYIAGTIYITPSVVAAERGEPR